ncbi:Serine/threonine-protein kinase MARK2 [Balamuthia mandrillaris]
MKASKNVAERKAVPASTSLSRQMGVMAEGIITINTKGIICSVNQKTLQIFGYDSPSELLGKSVNALLPQPYRDQHDAHIERYLSTGVPTVMGSSRLVEGLRKNGTQVTIRLALSELKIGEQVYFCGLVEPVQRAIAEITINTAGIILKANPGTKAVFDYQPAELIGKNVNILIEPSAAAQHDKYLAKYSDKNDSPVVGKVRNLTARKKDGTLITVSNYVTTSGEGSHRVFSAQLQPITEEIESVITMTTDGIIKSINDNCLIMFGYTREELVENDVGILFVPPYDSYAKKMYRKRGKRALTVGKRLLKAKHKDGSVFFVYVGVVHCKKGMVGCTVSPALNRTPHGVCDIRLSDIDKHIGNYAVIQTIADGIFGKIKLARHQLSLETVIIKTIIKEKVDPQHFKEIEVMRCLRHRHVVRLLEVIEMEDKYHIILGFVEGGELYEYAMARETLSEDEARIFWRQMLLAVNYMHQRNVVHRDLKLENVMLDRNGDVVIIDLGLAAFKVAGKKLSTFCGSTSYAAPEMFLCREYEGPEVDVWSLGVILYCLVLGYLPFEDPEHIVAADYIPLTNENVSAELVELFERIFRFEPSDRITVQDLLQHPWTNKGLEPLPLHEPDEKDTITEPMVRALEAFGFERKAIMESVQKGEYNQITASVWLLQQKLQRAAEGRRT